MRYIKRLFSSGEMWVGVTLAVVIELVPASLRTTSIAFYLFIITNIGGNIPLLVPPIQKALHNTGLTYTESLRGKDAFTLLNTLYSFFFFRGEITPLSSSYNISGLVPVCWLLFQCF